MPIGTSDGKFYKDDFDFFTNNGKEVIDPKTIMPPNTDSKMEVLDPQMIQPDVLDSQRDLEISSQRRSQAPLGAGQDASISHTEPRTDVLQGPEVSTYQTEMDKSQMGLRDTIRQGAQAIQQATGIGKESYVQDFLTKFKNSKELLDQYFEGKIEHNDPNLVNAVTTLASTAGGVGIASAPLRTSSVGTFGGTLGLKEIAKTSPKSLEPFASAITKYREGLKNNNSLYAETGWWRDPRDNMWKFEISDEQASLKNVKIPEGSLVLKSEDIKIEGSDQVGLRNYWAPSTTETKVGDVLDHPALYKAYPELKDLPIIYEKDAATPSFTRPNQDGSVVPFIAVDERWMTNKSKEGKIRTLLHEIQHWIQEKENFARGEDFMQIDAPERYWATPGEIEARNVEERYSSKLRGRPLESPIRTANPMGYNDEELARAVQN